LIPARSGVANQQSWAPEAIKHQTLHRFNFFVSIKRVFASLLKFFAGINVFSLHWFPNLPQLP
jgi:hypothetical protein